MDWFGTLLLLHIHLRNNLYHAAAAAADCVELLNTSFSDINAFSRGVAL